MRNQATIAAAIIIIIIIIWEFFKPALTDGFLMESDWLYVPVSL